jgi:hypothetical protein
MIIKSTMSQQKPLKNVEAFVDELMRLPCPQAGAAPYSHSLRCFLANMASSLSNLAAKSADISL